MLFPHKQKYVCFKKTKKLLSMQVINDYTFVEYKGNLIF